MNRDRLELHNIPIPLTPEQRAFSKRLKAIMRARRGHRIAPIDYSSIELRMAHFYGFDKAVYARLYGNLPDVSPLG